MSLEIIIFFAFLLIALIYSSAGFGGGSSYISMMALLNLPYKAYPIMALFCNLIVVLFSSTRFFKNNLISWKKILPWILSSIPFAYLGAKVKLSEGYFLGILSFLLFISGLKILFDNYKMTKSNKEYSQFEIKKINNKTAFFIGGVIGYVSGLVGIGGGIFLSPILNYWKLDRAKNIAITTTLFILFNSISAIIGKVQDPVFLTTLFRFWPLIVAVFIGGQIGNHWCIFKAKERQVSILSGLLTVIASITILIKLFH